MGEPGRWAAPRVRLLGRAVVALLSVGVLVLTGYGWGVQRELGSGLTTSDVVGGPGTPGGPVTALLVGIDSRTDAQGHPLPPELLDRLHAGADEGQLHTDTIIVLHLPADPTAPAIALSIPRDSFVPLAHGHGTRWVAGRSFPSRLPQNGA